ncbi:MAG: Nif3-like dinuclear metal center hexameric protein [Chloroflexota bacterium]
MIEQSEVVAMLNDLAPTSLAESWDNVGWQVRCGTAPITGILCSVDATEAVIEEARQRGANLVIAHHPLLFRPLHAVDTSSRVGGVLASALRGNISIISAHTNWDAAPGGISWALARRLGLTPETILQPSPLLPHAGLGVIAHADTPIDTHQLIRRARVDLASSVVTLVGTAAEHTCIALMGGSGTSGISAAAESGATLYITADVRYHEAQEAESLGLSLIVIDHGASELPGMAELGQVLASRLSVPVSLSQTRTSPWRYIAHETN